MNYNECNRCYNCYQSSRDKIIIRKEMNSNLLYYYSFAPCSIDMERQFRENVLHKARRYVTRIITDVTIVIIHRCDRTIIRRMRTDPIPVQCACPKGKIARLSVDLRAAGREVAAAHRARLLSKRARREREKIHRYIHRTRPGPRGSCVVKPVRFYDRLLPTS